MTIISAFIGQFPGRKCPEGNVRLPDKCIEFIDELMEWMDACMLAWMDGGQIYPPIRPYTYTLSIHPSTHPSIHTPTHPSTPPTHPSLHRSVDPHHPSTPPTHPPIHPSVLHHPFIH